MQDDECWMLSAKKCSTRKGCHRHASFLQLLYHSYLSFFLVAINALSDRPTGQAHLVIKKRDAQELPALYGECFPSYKRCHTDCRLYAQDTKLPVQYFRRSRTMMMFARWKSTHRIWISATFYLIPPRVYSSFCYALCEGKSSKVTAVKKTTIQQENKLFEKWVCCGEFWRIIFSPFHPWKKIFGYYQWRISAPIYASAAVVHLFSAVIIIVVLDIGWRLTLTVEIISPLCSNYNSFVVTFYYKIKEALGNWCKIVDAREEINY